MKYLLYKRKNPLINPESGQPVTCTEFFIVKQHKDLTQPIGEYFMKDLAKQVVLYTRSQVPGIKHSRRTNFCKHWESWVHFQDINKERDKYYFWDIEEIEQKNVKRIIFMEAL